MKINIYITSNYIIFFKIIIIKAYYYCAIEREIKRLNFLRLMVMYRVEIKMKYSTPKIIF